MQDSKDNLYETKLSRLAETVNPSSD